MIAKVQGLWERERERIVIIQLNIIKSLTVSHDSNFGWKLQNAYFHTKLVN